MTADKIVYGGGREGGKSFFAQRWPDKAPSGRPSLVFDEWSVLKTPRKAGDDRACRERLNRSLGQKARWIKEELSQMAEAAMLGVDEILGLPREGAVRVHESRLEQGVFASEFKNAPL